MSTRQEILEKVRREISALKTAAIRLQGEAFGFVLKLEDLERQAVELAAEGEVRQ